MRNATTPSRTHHGGSRHHTRNRAQREGVDGGGEGGVGDDEGLGAGLGVVIVTAANSPTLPSARASRQAAYSSQFFNSYTHACGVVVSFGPLVGGEGGNLGGLSGGSDDEGRVCHLDSSALGSAPGGGVGVGHGAVIRNELSHQRRRGRRRDQDDAARVVPALCTDSRHEASVVGLIAGHISRRTRAFATGLQASYQSSRPWGAVSMRVTHG